MLSFSSLILSCKSSDASKSQNLLVSALEQIHSVWTSPPLPPPQTTSVALQLSLCLAALTVAGQSWEEASATFETTWS
jgi:hypothetical protein